jgi:multisubunit Na+/H+ antiporter MnhC subunit
MSPSRRLLAVAAGTCTFLVFTASGAVAQSIVDNTTVPEENRSPLAPLVGPISFAVIFAAIAVVVALALTVIYMRYAPRFARDEETAKVVRADRVLPGREPPRRTVDLSQAAPMVVQPPQVPALAAAAAAPAAAPAPAVAAAAPAAPPAAPAPPAAEAPPTAPAAAPAAAPPAPPAAAPEERVEVTMDQEVFEATLAELLEQGTDRRIAEGKARRAGMIAAKKKAAGGA